MDYLLRSQVQCLDELTIQVEEGKDAVMLYFVFSSLIC